MIKISDIYKLEKSKKYINDVIDSNWISFTGKYVDKCEEKLKDTQKYFKENDKGSWQRPFVTFKILNKII